MRGLACWQGYRLFWVIALTNCWSCFYRHLSVLCLPGWGGGRQKMTVGARELAPRTRKCFRQAQKFRPQVQASEPPLPGCPPALRVRIYSSFFPRKPQTKEKEQEIQVCEKCFVSSFILKYLGYVCLFRLRLFQAKCTDLGARRCEVVECLPCMCETLG